MTTTSLTRHTSRISHTLLFALLALVLGAGVLAAQNRLDPVGMGQGQASAAGTSGIGAIASNPGALDYRTRRDLMPRREWTVSVFNIGGTLGGTFLSGSELGDIFSTGLSDQASRVRLGEQLQSGRLFANGANNLFTACLTLPNRGTLALHYGQRLLSSINLPDAVAAVLVRNELFEPHLDFFNEGVTGLWTSEFGVSFGTTFGDREWRDGGSMPVELDRPRGEWFPEISVGGTAKLLLGVTSQTLDDQSAITIERTTSSNALAYHFRGGYVVRSAEPTGFNIGSDISSFQFGLPAGMTGFGIGGDLGVHGVLYRRNGKDAVLFGLTVQDIGSVTWSTNAMERRALEIDTVIAFNGNLSTEVLDSFSGDTASIDEYSTPLPTVVRAGLAVNLPALTGGSTGSGVQLSLEGELPMNRAAGSVDDARVSLGGEYRLSSSFALRTGLRFGGINSFGVGLGFGWRIADWLTLDAGSSELNSFFGGDRVDLALRFTGSFGEGR